MFLKLLHHVPDTVDSTCRQYRFDLGSAFSTNAPDFVTVCSLQCGAVYIAKRFTSCSLEYDKYLSMWTSAELQKLEYMGKTDV